MESIKIWINSILIKYVRLRSRGKVTKSIMSIYMQARKDFELTISNCYQILAHVPILMQLETPTLSYSHLKTILIFLFLDDNFFLTWLSI